MNIGKRKLVKYLIAGVVVFGIALSAIEYRKQEQLELEGLLWLGDTALNLKQELERLEVTVYDLESDLERLEARVGDLDSLELEVGDLKNDLEQLEWELER